MEIKFPFYVKFLKDLDYTPKKSENPFVFSNEMFNLRLCILFFKRMYDLKCHLALVDVAISVKIGLINKSLTFPV